jgi:hypothetical protein
LSGILIVTIFTTASVRALDTNESAALFSALARGERTSEAALVFELPVHDIYVACQMEKNAAKIRHLLEKRKWQEISVILMDTLPKQPACYPFWDLAIALEMSGKISVVTDITKNSNLKISKVFVKLGQIVRLLFENKGKKARSEMQQFMKETGRHLPAMRLFSMFPEGVVDFKEKAEFSRYCLQNTGKFNYATMADLFYCNALVQSLEYGQACERRRQEMQMELPQLIQDNGKIKKGLTPEEKVKLHCPIGSPYRLQRIGTEQRLHCPLHP